ncbi:MAG TPA: hypothetical protein VKT82_05475 [Ktedonobacterales bacterium]|nr:hypothetical protein [Ktedonobacterales bacterium]
MLENLNEGRIQGGNAAEETQQRGAQIAGYAPVRKVVTTPRGVKFASNLALIALLGVILLALGFWLSGLRLPFLPSIPDQPSLSLSSGPYRVGSVMTIQGAHFSHFSIIVLLFDGEPATDGTGQRQAVNSDGQGAFTTTLTILPAWGPGDHILGAKDTRSGLEASLDISIEKATSLRGLTAAARLDLLERKGQQRRQIARQQPGIA